jgi:hypothetical protein
MITFASHLLPIARIAVEGGPMKVTPSFSHLYTNFSFSLKNPYPGWIA